MATPLLYGVGAIAAALVGRNLVRRGIIGGKRATEEWVKGGFKSKMDRKEAIAILGLKCVVFASFLNIYLYLNSFTETAHSCGTD